MEAVGDPACYLAEWYLPELTEQTVDDIVARLEAAAATVSGEGTPVRLLVTLSVPTRAAVVHPILGAMTTIEAGSTESALQWTTSPPKPRSDWTTNRIPLTTARNDRRA